MAELDRKTEFANPTVFVRHSLYSDPPRDGWPDTFPFPTRLSFLPVIEHWRNLAARKPEVYREDWLSLERQLESAPELLELVTSRDVIERNETLIASLVRPLFPGSDWSSEAKAISDPLGRYYYASTNRTTALLGATFDEISVIHNTTPWIRTMYAYRGILKRFYGFDLPIDRPLIFDIQNVETGLSRYLKLNATQGFERIVLEGELPPLTREDVELLVANSDDYQLWSSRLPHDRFAFEGLNLITFTDVTHEIASASVTHLVLESDANITEENFEQIEIEVRNLFRDGSLRLGLASIQADGNLNYASDRRVWNSLCVRDAVRQGELDLSGSIYERALKDGVSISIPDLDHGLLGPELRKVLQDLGVKSLFCLPLRYEGQTVGLLELTSPNVDALHGLTSLKMSNIQSVFALAVHQNLERFESRVDSVIQKAYTAIHPAVAWRFRDAAIAVLESEKSASTRRPASIYFEKLFGLFGSADIRGSSEHRNRAIRNDILNHLARAHAAVRDIRNHLPLAIADEIQHRINERILGFEADWQAGDEQEAKRFIREDIDPAIESLCGGTHELESIWRRYRDGTGTDDSVVSVGRRAFENSQRQLNELIVSLLMEDQESAQAAFPHYFEHAKTDGVDYTLFVGQSICPDRPFSRAFLQDFRLRQLITSCRIATEAAALDESLELPLEIAQLILVQDAPVNLQFRSDEKRFDIEGASGIRFETLKKRLDKAVVRDTGERLTQPGRIAVVYSTDPERLEYERYVRYLEANRLIEPEVEHLTLADLQGATGLRAMRLAVQLESGR